MDVVLRLLVKEPTFISELSAKNEIQLLDMKEEIHVKISNVFRLATAQLAEYDDLKDLWYIKIREIYLIIWLFLK